jgi:DHA1 family bicyclomycin/chloramphenicol resistance-like MFS transporter
MSRTTAQDAVPAPSPGPSAGIAPATGRIRRDARSFEAGRMPVWLILLLGSLSAVGPLSTDMYLPAFPTIDATLGGGPGSSQITLAAWFAGLAIGQFTQGPFSDRFGRRAPLLVGMSIYTLGSIGCAQSHAIWSFTACRFLAALGGSSGMVIPRAVVRDVATGPQGSRIMSQLMLVLGVVPILAPTLGGLVLSVATWRWIFWVATIYGLVSLALVAWALPDTLPRENRVRLPPVEVLGRYLTILNDRSFLSNTCVCGFATFVIFGYLSGAPIAFERILRFSPTQFGILFGVNAFFYILCTQINAHVVHRVGMERLLRFGIVLLGCAASLFLVLVLTGVAGAGRPAVFVCLPIMALMASMGFISPNATVFALGGHARNAGSASALLGTLQFGLGSISGIAMGLMPVTTLVPMACIITCGVIGMLFANAARPKRPA